MCAAKDHDMPESHDSFDPPEPPHDEAWWERNLFQNEKLIDKYMDVLGDDPDWEKWSDPRDLYNKVHYGIEPGEPLPPGVEDDDWNENEFASLDMEDFGSLDDDGEFGEEVWSTETASDAEDDPAHATEAGDVDPFDGLDDDDEPRDLILGGERLTDEEIAEYRQVYRRAFDFGVRMIKLESLPEESVDAQVAAGKIGANLAGGHGLGYTEDTLCGNIVKCRWALAECEFVLDTLEFLASRTGQAEFAELLADGRRLHELIVDRIAKLRRKVGS